MKKEKVYYIALSSIISYVVLLVLDNFLPTYISGIFSTLVFAIMINPTFKNK